MPRGLKFDRKWKPAAPNCGQQFLAGLDGSLCPAMLLRFKPVHIHWKFSGGYNVRKKDKFPTDKLGAIAEIKIFAERVVLPAASLLDTGTPPETGRSIEIEKPAASAARGLLEQEMAIQKDRLHAGEQRITAIQMAPSRLDHSYVRIAEEMDRAL